MTLTTTRTLVLAAVAASLYPVLGAQQQLTLPEPFATPSTRNQSQIVPQAYNAGQPIFKGVFEDNDRTKPLQMIVNYNTDISQFWEWSSVGLRPIDQTNEAYKLGVNYIIYGMTH